MIDRNYEDEVNYPKPELTSTTPTTLDDNDSVTLEAYRDEEESTDLHGEPEQHGAPHGAPIEDLIALVADATSRGLPDGSMAAYKDEVEKSAGMVCAMIGVEYAPDLGFAKELPVWAQSLVGAVVIGITVVIVRKQYMEVGPGDGESRS